MPHKPPNRFPIKPTLIDCPETNQFGDLADHLYRIEELEESLRSAPDHPHPPRSRYVWGSSPVEEELEPITGSAWLRRSGPPNIRPTTPAGVMLTDEMLRQMREIAGEIYITPPIEPFGGRNTR